MGWLDALAGIAENVAATGYAGGKKAIGYGGDVFDASERFGKAATGTGLYGIAKPLSYIPGGWAESQFGVPVQAYEHGYDGYHGGRAIWEQMQSDNPLLVRGALDVLNPGDPMNILGYLTGAEAGRAAVEALPFVGMGLRGAEPLIGAAAEDAPWLARMRGVPAATEAVIPAWQRAAGYGLQGAGAAVRGAERAVQLPGELAFRGATYPVRKLVGPWIKPGNTSLFTTENEAMLRSLSEQRATEMGVTSPVRAPRLPQINPNTPVPNQVTAREAAPAYTRLRSWLREGVFAPLGAIYQTSRGPTVDIPGAAKHTLPPLSEEQLNGLAWIVADQAQNVFNDIKQNEQFIPQWLVQMPERVRAALLEKAGPGYAEYLDAIWRRARELTPEGFGEGVKLPDPFWTNVSVVPELSATVKVGKKDVPLGSLGVRGLDPRLAGTAKEFAGSASNPRAQELLAARLAAAQQNLLQGGQAKSFMPGETGETPGLEELGGLYNAERGKIKAPSAFTRLLDATGGERVTGPYRLEYGATDEAGNWRTAKDLIAEEMGREWGINVADHPEYFDALWKLATEYTYQSHIRAAMEYDVNPNTIAGLKAKGLSNAEIEEYLGTGKPGQAVKLRLLKEIPETQLTPEERDLYLGKGTLPEGAGKSKGLVAARIKKGNYAPFEKKTGIYGLNPEGEPIAGAVRNVWETEDGRRFLAEGDFPRNRFSDRPDFSKPEKIEAAWNKMLKAGKLSTPFPGLSENPSISMLPALERLIDNFHGGAALDEGGHTPDEWYERAAEELTYLFGPMNLSDVHLFFDLVAVTSPQRKPLENLKFTLWAWNNVKMGNPEFLESLGLSRWQVENLPEVVARQSSGMTGQMKKNVGLAFARANPADPAYLMNTGAAKTTGYGRSFLVNQAIKAIEQAPKGHFSARNDVGEAVDSPELRAAVVADIKRASTEVADDIWHNRNFGWGDSPDNIQYAIAHFRTLDAAKKLGVMPSGFQAGVWFPAKAATGTGGEDFIDTIAGMMMSYRKQLMARGIDTPTINDVMNDWLKNLITGKLDHTGLLTSKRLAAISDHLVNEVLPSLERGDNLFHRYEFVDPGSPHEVLGKIAEAGLVPDDRGYQAVVPLVRSRAMDPGNKAQAHKVIAAFFKDFREAIESKEAEGRLRLQAVRGDDGKVTLELAMGVDPRAPAAPGIIPAGGPTPEGVPTAEEITHARGRATSLVERRGERKITNSAGLLKALRLQIDNEGQLGMVPPTDPLTGWMLGKMEGVQRGVSQHYLAESARQVSDRVSRIKGRTLGELTPEDIVGPLERVPAGQSARISDNAREILNRTFTKGNHVGETRWDVFRTYRERMAKGLDDLRRSGVEFAADSSLETKKSLVKSKIPGKSKDAEWALGQLDKLGIDHTVATADSAAGEYLQHQLAIEYDHKPQKLTRYGVIKTAWGEQALLTPRYHVSNVIGAWMQQLVAGYPIRDTMSPRQYWRNFLAVWNNEGRDITQENMRVLKIAEISRKWGDLEPPAAVLRANVTQGQGLEKRTGSLQKVVTKVTPGEKIGSMVGWIANVSHAMAQSWEQNIRGSLYSDLYDTTMTKHMVVLENDLRRVAAENGVALERLPHFATNPGEQFGPGGPHWGALAEEGDPTRSTGIFAAGHIEETLVEAGIPQGAAEDIQRKFLNLREQAKAAAVKETNRVHFSYDFTNLDEAIAKVIPFHYWASRALRFYAEEAVRHPVFLYKYAQLREGMDRMQEDPGLDGRSKGFINLLDSPQGFSLLMNPESLLGVVKMFDMDSGVTPDGETRIGKLVRISKQHGVGLFPWIDATLNYMGAYGDTFAPDPAGLRTKQLVGAVVNVGRAQLGMEPAPAPYDSANVKLREWISGLTASLAPDWLSQPVQAKASEDGTLARATLDDVIASRVLAENPNLTNQQMLDILNNPDSPEYESAYQDAANAGLLAQMLNFMAPVSFKERESSRDVARAQVNTIRKAAADAGVPPDDYVPTLADAEFLTTYKNLTGKDWQPGDYNKAQFKRDIATATPKARPFVIQETEYSQLGPPEGQAILAKANDIRAGRWLPPGMENKRLSADELDLVADYYVQTHDPSGETAKVRSAQKLYRETHPQFDAFKSWQGQMFNLTASYGPQGFAHYRDLISQSNPNAARYFAARQEYLIKHNPGASPAQLQRMLDSATISPDAWLAVTGQAQNQYEANPLPTNGTDPATQAVAFQQFQQSQHDGHVPANWLQVLQSYA
jgi:hypothetical protein